MNLKALVALALALSSISAGAATTSINLGGYTVGGIYSLAINPGGTVSGLEGSAITYARDRGTLFYVGDEGTGVVEISKTGATLGTMAFNWAGTATTNRDTEGLTYLGGGNLVVAEERLYDAYSFQYLAGGTATLANNQVSISNAVVGNNGLEGISYDPRNGSFVTIKQQSPRDILAGNLTFNSGVGVSTMTNLFNPASLGVTTLSDVQTLSPVDALSGEPAADNLLILSLGSNKLLETDRLGNIKSVFNLSTLGLTFNAIEGVTVDENGTIYLIAEQNQSTPLLASTSPSQLIVLTAPVPEPEIYAMMLAGLGLIGFARRRRKQT